ncbi:ESCRT-II complex, vps25 subunit [Xylariomycetidae sp. FL0641]|nr:ESCRT-II complex, vps25 subunit [Xylariomycetidae sp. FL0641]
MMTTPPPPPPLGGPTASAPTTTTSTTFEFPIEYHFPPFFTRQPNATTWHAVQSKWSALILAWCAHHRAFRLSLPSAVAPTTTTSNPSLADELFHNRRLGKRLGRADAREVFAFMRREGRVEFVHDDAAGGGEGDVFVYWRTPDEWAALIEDWVEQTAQKGAVLTLYELTEGEDTRGTEFHGLEPEILQKALQVLVKRGKAQIFGQEDQRGVKFF